MLSIFVFPTQTSRPSLRDFRYSLPVRIAWAPFRVGWGSGLGGLGGGIGPLAIDQRGAGIGMGRGEHTREEDAVGADLHRLSDVAVERNKRVGGAGCPGGEPRPFVLRETVLHWHAAGAGEQLRHVDLLGTKPV